MFLRFGCLGGLVDHTFRLAFTFQWAVGFLAAIAVVWCSGLIRMLVEDGLVMGGDDGFYVGHATITQFEGVPVKYLVQHVVAREAFVYDFKKLLADVSGDVTVVRRVKPNDISVSIAVFFLWFWVECQIVVVAALGQGVLVRLLSGVK